MNCWFLPHPATPRSFPLSFPLFLLDIYSGVLSSRDYICRFLRSFQINRFKTEKVIIDSPWWCSPPETVRPSYVRFFKWIALWGKKRWNMQIYKNDGYLYSHVIIPFSFLCSFNAFISWTLLKEESRSTH